MTSRLAVLLLLAATLTIPARPRLSRADDAPAAARPTDEARRASKRHFERGKTAFALGQFKDALRHYEAAYKAAALPRLLFNIGQCHANMKNYERALFSFQKYLDEVPNASNRAEVERYIRDIERERDADRAAQRALEPNLVPSKPERTPVYKRWWFIAGTAAVVAAAATTATIRLWPDGGCQTDACLDFDE